MPVELAYQLYEACMVTRTGVKHDVEALYNWFKKVDFGWGVHLGTYYNLRRRLYMYINGPKYPELVFLEPVIPAPHLRFGFGTILFPETDVILQHIRRVRVLCGEPFCTHAECKCDCNMCQPA